MTHTEQVRMQNTIQGVDAIFALEGFAPTVSSTAMDRAVLAGVGSYEDAIQELRQYVQKNKSAQGFIYSKAAGLA